MAPPQKDSENPKLAQQLKLVLRAIQSCGDSFVPNFAKVAEEEETSTTRPGTDAYALATPLRTHLCSSQEN
jgi:hypothetical protein